MAVGTNIRDKAIQMADANPQAALVFAVLDLAQAVRENGTDLENITKQHEQLAVNIGGVADAINNVGAEIAHQ